jgi:dihydroorotate dehydrogenase (NAD+) catalytic subunit
MPNAERWFAPEAPTMKPDMRVTLCGIDLVNPIIAASGTFGYGAEFEEIVNFRKIGGFVTKGVSPEPMAGNQAPRLIETAAGMINAIGLQNVGVDKFIAEKLPPLCKYPACATIVNVFGATIEDYVTVINRLNEADGIAAYELNASCPNTRHGGIAFGSDPDTLFDLVSRTKSRANRPLIVKLSPNVTSIALMAQTAQRAGADALSLVNTFLALSIDTETRRPRLSNVTGGLSGPAIKPIAVRMAWEAAKAVKIPIIGLGGIVAPEDVVEFLLAGATAVQIGTASYADPRATERIANELEQWCARHHVARVADLTGAMEVTPPAE